MSPTGQRSADAVVQPYAVAQCAWGVHNISARAALHSLVVDANSEQCCTTCPHVPLSLRGTLPPTLTPGYPLRLWVCCMRLAADRRPTAVAPRCCQAFATVSHLMCGPHTLIGCCARLTLQASSQKLSDQPASCVSVHLRHGTRLLRDNIVSASPLFNGPAWPVPMMCSS
jgi:hypothetical protein